MICTTVNIRQRQSKKTSLSKSSSQKIKSQISSKKNSDVHDMFISDSDKFGSFESLDSHRGSEDESAFGFDAIIKSIPEDLFRVHSETCQTSHKGLDSSQRCVSTCEGFREADALEITPANMVYPDDIDDSDNESDDESLLLLPPNRRRASVSRVAKRWKVSEIDAAELMSNFEAMQSCDMDLC